MRYLVACCLFACAFAASSAARSAESFTTNKNFEDLTPAERNAAKAAAEKRKLPALRVCADPANMPFSNENKQGFDNKILEVLAKALDTEVVYFWRPSLERGLTLQTFENNACDILLDLPSDTEGLLMSLPIYRTTYVLTYRSDKGLDIKGLDDHALKSLKVGVFQMSGMRFVLAKHGIRDNVEEHIISHDADLVPEHQPWRQVQDVVDGKLDVAAVWGPFAGWLKAKGAPLSILPVNLMDDTPLEFEIALGMRKTDVVLKYMIDGALERSRDEIKKILTEYGVPLVRCGRCVASGDLPTHGAYVARAQAWRDQFLQPVPASRMQVDKSRASADQIVTKERVETWLKEGSSLDQELSYAVLSADQERAKFLIEKGADVNWRNAEGFEPLHIAARQRDSEMIVLLAEHGADVNAGDSDGWTPLLHAVLRNHVPSIQGLLSHGAKIELAAPGGFTPLAVAIEEGNFYAAKALLDAGASVNTAIGPHQLTPLMIVASKPQVERRAASLAQGPGAVDLARALIVKGADINAASGNGATPLMIAAARDNSAVIALLAESGADTRQKDKSGKTALDIARDNGSDQARQILDLYANPASPGEPGVPAAAASDAQGQ